MRIVASLIWAVVVTGTASAQSAVPVPTAYQPYRYDEDWSALCDERWRTDWLDRLKCVPLREDSRWYLSLGGETRWRYEQFRNPGFGAQPRDRSGYLLQRHLLHTDWNFGRRARLFVEFQSGLEKGRLGGPRPTDEDRLDVHQAFVDVTWGSASRGTLTLRTGRHEVAFGAGRLISAAEGLNVRRSFDGLRLIGRRGRWTANATLMRLVATRSDVFDDHADRQQLTWGTGAFGPLPGGTRGNLAIYCIGMERHAATFQQGIEDATRHSFGARIWRIGRTFDYDEEIIVQTGRFGASPIRAWAFASEQGVTPPRLPGRTRVGVRAFFASGDRDPSDATLESLDPLFPGIAYSGKASLIGPTNLITIGPSLAVSPHPRVRLTSDWATFWRTSRNDGLYGINVSLLRSGVATDTRHVGSQATAEVDVRVSRHITVWASITGFRTGTFLRSSPPGENVRYVATHVAYRF